MKAVFKKEIEKINKGLQASFQKIKKELDSYLDTINQNTNEIQSNYEFLIELDKKVEALSERIDELTLMINPKQSFINQEFDLSLREQEVFLVLYAINKKFIISAKSLSFFVNSYII